MPTVRLQSSDGHIFEVEADVAKVSETIHRLMEELGIHEEGSNDVLPLPNVRASILEKVIAWATEHRDDPLLLADDDEEWLGPIGVLGREPPFLPSAWDREFLEVDRATLLEILTAANELEIKGLRNLACKSITKLIRGKTAEQILQMFGIENDLPSEEEQKLRWEKQWLAWCQLPAEVARYRERGYVFSARGRRRAAARRLGEGPEWFS